MPLPPPPTQAIIARALADALIPSEDQLLAMGERENSIVSWSRWAPPGSTAIRQVNHRLRDGMMTVRFANSATDYLFYDVPRELFRQWKRVVSPGRFYHRRIKGRYSVT